jgi:hypothetical protein
MIDFLKRFISSIFDSFFLFLKGFLAFVSMLSPILIGMEIFKTGLRIPSYEELVLLFDYTIELPVFKLFALGYFVILLVTTLFNWFAILFLSTDEGKLKKCAYYTERVGSFFLQTIFAGIVLSFLLIFTTMALEMTNILDFPLE